MGQKQAILKLRKDGKSDQCLYTCIVQSLYYNLGKKIPLVYEQLDIEQVGEGKKKQLMCDYC